MKIKSIRDVKKLTGKKVLLRADFNVPIESNKIKDDYKIVAGLPTIRFLLRHRCKVIIATHLGRPFQKTENRKQKTESYSVKPIAARLSRLLGRKVKFVEDCVGFKVGTAVSKMKNGQILMLENLRFYKGEESNNKKFAKELAMLVDLYVNDAFGVSHRNHASVSAIKKYLPSYAGVLLEQELMNLNKVLKPEKPLILIIGGAKIATKIKLIKKLGKLARRILIGGALANNFFKAHKLEVGKSVVDSQSIKFAKKWKSKNIILPIDVVVCRRKDGSGQARVKNVYMVNPVRKMPFVRVKPQTAANYSNSQFSQRTFSNGVNKNEIILDIGPETIRLYNNFIKKAKTIIWNGPMGMFEQEHFKHGTLAIARVIAACSGGSTFGVAGGGETVEALKMTKMLDYVDWVSTGGGAMLAYLGGERMPGLMKLEVSRRRSIALLRSAPSP